MQTKGPWIIAEGMVISGRRDDGKEQPIAAVFGIVEYGDSRDKEKAAANRHLLASALDLLAALESLVDVALCYNNNRIEIICASYSEAFQRVKIARAALSKAKGKV